MRTLGHNFDLASVGDSRLPDRGQEKNVFIKTNLTWPARIPVELNSTPIGIENKLYKVH